MTLKFKSSDPPNLPPILTESNGRRRKGSWINCPSCSLWFVGRPFKNGELPTYCSRKCRNKGLTGESVSLTCDLCGSGFTRQKARHLSIISLNKTELCFCSRKCKDAAQRLTSDFPQIRPDHYGSGSGISTYRDLALSELGSKCVDCDITYAPFLQIHHIDGDRENNCVSNLEVLCANHHLTRHMRLVEGIWIVSNVSLTPRENLVDILSLLDIE